MSKNGPLNHLRRVLRVVAKASQWHFHPSVFCGCFHASLSLLFPLRMFHPQLISSFFSSWKICEQMSVGKKKEHIGKERRGKTEIKNEINKTKMKSWTVVPWTHMPAQLFLAVGTEPGWHELLRPRWHGQRKREKDIHESRSLSGSWRLLLVLLLQPITSAALEAALIYRVQT